MYSFEMIGSLILEVDKGTLGSKVTFLGRKAAISGSASDMWIRFSPFASGLLSLLLLMLSAFQDFKAVSPRSYFSKLY